MDFIGTVLAVLGAVGGTSGVIALYTAKAKRRGMEADNKAKEVAAMQGMINEAQEERKALREMHAEYRKETDLKIEKMGAKIEEYQRKNTLKLRAINSAYRCRLPDQLSDCPVLKTLDEECERNDGLCDVK